MKYRSRKFCILLYLDNKEHLESLEYIKNNFDYAYIIHDKDTDKNGELKKEHIHLVLSCVNAKWNTALSDEINLSLNFIQQCRNFEKALEYLIHYADDSKYQYDINEVQGNLKSKLIKQLNNSDKDENDKVKDLINYINNNNKPISVTEFSAYCASQGMWDVFRRASFIFISLINEHNELFRKNYYRKN